MAVQVGISYFDGSRLRRSLLAAADWVAAGRDELNRLNVFPVPDGDTGTNMCLTLRAVAQALRAKAADLARAIRTGFDHLRASLDEPVEGTILTVARETAEEAGLAHAEPDLRVFMVRLVRRAEAALQRTPDLLAALKTAGVVDAGAKGFVRFLEGVKRLIEDGQVAAGAVDRLTPNAAAQAEVSADRDYRFCTELMVRGASLPPAADVRRALRAFGGSIVVLQTGDLLKAHVHTDTPDAVFQAGTAWGTVEYTKADDMRAQHQALQARRPIAFVSDTACDLPDELVVQYDIGLVPTQLIVDEVAYRDRLELTSAEFFGRLRAGLDATTSQPSPQAFTDGYADAARGVELAAAAWVPDTIARELERVRAQSGGFFTVDNFDRLVRSGRVGRGRAWLGTKLNLKPVMVVTPEGAIAPAARVRGSAAARRRILELLDRALAGRARRALPAEAVSRRADHPGDRRARGRGRVGRFLSGRGRNKRMTRAL